MEILHVQLAHPLTNTQSSLLLPQDYTLSLNDVTGIVTAHHKRKGETYLVFPTNIKNIKVKFEEVEKKPKAKSEQGPKA